MRHFDPCPPPPPRRKQQHDASLPQAIQWAWELSTKVFGLPAERVWVSVYEQDDEAYAIWRDVVGVPEARIRRMGAADNFWASGPTGEGGMGRGEKAESAERRRRRRRRRRQGRSKGALERAMEKAAALCLPARPPFPSQLSNTARPRQTKQHRLPRVHTPPPGPCGPCSELYYDFHPERGAGADASLEDDARFIEFYNLVFMELNRGADGSLTPLAAKNIDTGMGLERMAQIVQVRGAARWSVGEVCSGTGGDRAAAAAAAARS